MRWLALAMLSACQSPGADAPADRRLDQESIHAASRTREPSVERDAFPRPDPERTSGYLLSDEDEEAWGIRMRYPFSVGITDFDLDTDFSLDKLTTASAVPTLELPIFLDELWTVQPFMGLGLAYQNGDRDLVGGNRFIGLYTAGLRAQRWQPFARRYAWLLKSEVRYDAALNRRNGLLGDWGSVDAAVEVRRVFGSPGDGFRVQPGVYVQGIHFWQAVELEIDGVSPEFIDDQYEVGISLGTSQPYRVLWFNLPRVLIGVRLANELRGLRIRFGRL